MLCSTWTVSSKSRSQGWCAPAAAETVRSEISILEGDLGGAVIEGNRRMKAASWAFNKDVYDDFSQLDCDLFGRLTGSWVERRYQEFCCS